MPINATFHGFIETTTDSLLLFEACRRGVLPKISRRLQERERGTVKSGTVFIFDEKESGIKRWTDGLIWSPSRILGNFLIYRELGGRETINDKSPLHHDMISSNPYQYNPYSSNSPYIPQQHHLLYQDNMQESLEEEEYDEHMTIEERNRERNLVGSLTDTYKFRKGGLIKKTLSIQLNGCTQHLISYYTKEDVLKCRLATPSSIAEISCLQISPDLFLKQSFRVPPSVEFAELMLKRPSLSPSSTTSSSTSSSTTTTSTHHQVKKLASATTKNSKHHHHPYSPLLHQNHQYNQDEDEEHSLYHSRRPTYETPSLLNSRKSSRTSIDSTSGSSSRSSSYYNHPLDNNSAPCNSSGIPSIMTATNSSNNEFYNAGYHNEERRGAELNNTQSSFRALPIVVGNNNGSSIAAPIYESPTSSYHNINTSQPTATIGNNTASSNSAFIAAINNSYDNRDMNQQQRRHSHVISSVSLHSTSPPSRNHRNNSYPSAPPISSNYQQKLHEIPTISILSTPSTYQHQQQQQQSQNQLSQQPLLSPSRFLWSNNNNSKCNESRNNESNRRYTASSPLPLSSIPAKPANPSSMLTSPLYNPINNTTNNYNKQQEQQQTMNLPVNNTEIPAIVNEHSSRYYANNNKFPTSSSFISTTNLQQQQQQENFYYQQQQQSAAVTNNRYNRDMYNNNNTTTIMNSSTNNIATTRHLIANNKNTSFY